MAAIRASASRTASQKRADRGGVLDALATTRRRSARQRPRAAACRMPAIDVCGMQPTRQNEAKRGRRVERATNRRPFRRRRSPRRERRAGGLGALLKRRAKSSKSKPGAIRAAAGTAAPDCRALRRGVSSPWNCSRASGIAAQRPRRSSAAGALTKRPTGVTKGGRRARQRGRGARRVTWRGLRGVEDEADRIGAGVDGRVDVLARESGRRS